MLGKYSKAIVTRCICTFGILVAVNSARSNLVQTQWTFLLCPSSCIEGMFSTSCQTYCGILRGSVVTCTASLNGIDACRRVLDVPPALCCILFLLLLLMHMALSCKSFVLLLLVPPALSCKQEGLSGSPRSSCAV